MKNDNDKIKKGQDNSDKKAEEQDPVHECKCKQEKVELRQKIEERENSFKRALADYQNLQKRTAEERLNWLRIANKELLLRLLPILDTLMLAYKHTASEELKVSISQFTEVLKAEGVKKIDVEDRGFDPHLMEVVEAIEGEDGKVLGEVRAGYMVHDKLLRAAQVRVGKKVS